MDSLIKNYPFFLLKKTNIFVIIIFLSYFCNKNFNYKFYELNRYIVFGDF